MTTRKSPGPRRRATRDLTPVSSEWAALRCGYSPRREFSDDELRRLWLSHRDGLDDPKEWAAYWWHEHGLSRDDEAFAAARLYLGAPDLADEEIAERAVADPDFDDPRLD